MEKIIENFSNFRCLPPGKGREWMVLGATCCFMDAEFNLILNVG